MGASLIVPLVGMYYVCCVLCCMFVVFLKTVMVFSAVFL